MRTVHLQVPDGKVVEVDQQIQMSIASDRLRLQEHTIGVEKSANENPTPGTSANHVECTLISEEFVGAVVTLFFETADGTEFMVQVQERELDELNISQDTLYTLSWSEDAAHLLND